MGELKRKTVSGIKWIALSSVMIRILATLTTIVLARLLTPADFGMFALAMVMIDGFGVFKSLGFDTAMVRRGEDISKAANTAFFLIPTMGMCLFLILLIVAPIGAKFLGNPSVANIIRALGIIFVISCFGKVPQTILYRDMKFKYRSIAEVISRISFVIVAITLALNKFGIWSLVVAYVIQNLIQISIEWYFSGWKPEFEFDKKLAWEMFHFGKFILASSIVYFLYSNLDNLVIGKLLGVTMLGYYAIARNASNLLSDYFLGKVGMIMYPAYSKIQDNKEDVQRVLLKTLKYISIIAFPFGFGLFIFAPDILRVVFGEKWLPAANILRILAFVGIFRSLGAAIWPIFLARGKAKADFQINVVQVVIFFALVVPLAFKFGLMGVGFALLISTVISFFIGLIRIKRIIQIRILKIFESIKPALLCSLLMGSGIILLKHFLSNYNNIGAFAYYNLAAMVIFMVVVYSLLLFKIEKNVFKEMKEIIF